MTTRSSLPVEQILPILKDTPGRLAALTAGLSPEQLQAAPGPDEWSVNEVLAHLRACADVWGGCMATLLEQDRPTLRGVNPRAWIKETDYLKQQFQTSLQAFTAQRAALLAVLEALLPEGWARAGTVIDMVGKPLPRSVLFYADKLASHERTHVKQIEGMIRAMQPGAHSKRSSI